VGINTEHHILIPPTISYKVSNAKLEVETSETYLTISLPKVGIHI
jgi:hypothetical protein